MNRIFFVLLILGLVSAALAGTSTFNNNINMRDGSIIPPPDPAPSAPIVTAGQSRSITTKTPPVTNGQSIGAVLATTGGTPDDWTITNCPACAGFFQFHAVSPTVHTGQLEVASGGVAALNGLTSQTTYSPIVQASNSGGIGTATVTIIATPGNAGQPPVITAVGRQFPSMPVNIGATIVTLQATNNPTWSIVPSSDAAGDFTIDATSGALKWSSQGAVDYAGGPIVPVGGGQKKITPTLTIQASNAAGSATTPVNITAYADGYPNRTVAAVPQFPNLLNGGSNGPGIAYVARPPWKVAGVDYGVGVDPTTVLRDWRTIAGGCINVNVGGQVVSTNANNCVIENVDFSLGNGAGIDVNNSNVTIRNNKFAMKASLSDQFVINTGFGAAEDARTGLTVTRNSFIGTSGVCASGLDSLIQNAGSNMTLTYNYAVNFCQHIINIGRRGDSPPGQTLNYQFNMIHNGAMEAGPHWNCLQWGNGGYNNINVSFNTVWQTPTDGGFGNECWQFYENGGSTALTNIAANRNTVTASGGSNGNNPPTPSGGSDTINNVWRWDGPGTASPGQGLENYIDPTKIGGKTWGTDSMAGWSINTNVNMLNGTGCNWNNVPGGPVCTP